MESKTSKSWPLPGTVVSVPIFLFYRHKGIVSNHWHGGKPMVISTSFRTGGVREEPWDVFAQRCNVTADDYPGTLPSHEVLRRAKSLIGTQYDVFTKNCEHFVTNVHGLKPRSSQVALTLAIAAICIGVLSTAK